MASFEKRHSQSLGSSSIAPSHVRRSLRSNSVSKSRAHGPPLLTEVRGPKAARIYAQELDRQSASASAASNGEGQAFSPNPFPNAAGGKQEVLVLKDGFTGWQSLYRVSTSSSYARGSTHLQFGRMTRNLLKSGIGRSGVATSLENAAVQAAWDALQTCSYAILSSKSAKCLHMHI